MAVLLSLLALFGLAGPAPASAVGGDEPVASAGAPRACPDLRVRGGEADDVRTIALSCAEARGVIRDVAAGRPTFGITCTASERSGQPGELAEVCSGRELQVTWTQR